MRSTISCALLFALAATVGVGFAGSAGPVEPGGKIGTMKVVRGAGYEADLGLFNVCDPLVFEPGRFHRSCSVPRVPRMFIGYGWSAPTRKELDALWKRMQWSLWVDGRPVRLAPFGTFDRYLRSFGPDGKPAFLRQWKVILVGAPPGKHTVRYRQRDPSATLDGTWTVTVRK